MKKFLSGLLVGIILATMTTAFAASKITAYFNPDVKIRVDGVLLETEIVTVAEKQKNYTSVRDVAEALGATVEWNQETKTINITSKESEVDTVGIDTPKSTNTTIEYNPETGLPVGAEWVDFKDCKAISYNDKIYLSETDLAIKFNILYENNRDYRYITYKHGEDKIEVDFYNRENYIDSGKGIYLNKDLFAEFIGE